MRPWKRRIITNDLLRFIDLIGTGQTVSDAADAVGYSHSALWRHIKNDPELFEQYERARERFRDRIRAKNITVAFDDEHKLQGDALRRISVAYVPEFRETSRVEVAGQIEVSHVDREIERILGELAPAREAEAPLELEGGDVAPDCPA